MNKEQLLGKLRPVDKDGWMNKQGGNWKSWKRRWFALSGETLFYFDNNKVETVQRGSISIAGATVKEIKCGKMYTFGIAVTGRTYVMSCDSPDDYESWLNVCTAVASGNLLHYRNRITKHSDADIKIRLKYDLKNITEGLKQLAADAIESIPGVIRIDMKQNSDIMCVYGENARASDVLDSLEISGIDCELLAVKYL